MFPSLTRRILGIQDVTTVDRRNSRPRLAIFVSGILSFMLAGLCFYLCGLAWFGSWDVKPNFHWYDVGVPVMVLTAGSSSVLGLSSGISDLSNIQIFMYLAMILVFSAPLFFLAKLRVRSWYSADAANDSLSS